MRQLLPLNPTVRCIGVASALGAPAAGSERAPAVLFGQSIGASLRHQGLTCRLDTILHPRLVHAAPLHELLLTLAERTEGTILAGERPLVIGGDHAIAAGTWKGIARARGAMPGLIWIDAHLDAHTPATSPTGNLHGMPVAALLGAGDPDLVDIPGPKLNPQRLVMIGVRSSETAERAFLDRLGVRIFSADEVARRGLPAVLAEARRLLGTGPWGVSLDVDAIDPAAAPGVNTPVAAGLAANKLLPALRGLLRERDCIGFEIAEYNPAADPDGRTARLIEALIDAIAAPDDAVLQRWENSFGARNYAPLPVVLSQGSGCWVSDTAGRRYLDLMSAYSANSFGHAHPRLLAALADQAGRLALTSRAYANDRLPLLLRRLSLLSGYQRVLPVNTGLEAVETALKAARKWAYRIKGVPPGQAEIIACQGNFHGRSIAIVGLSSEAQYRDGFGPFPPGLKIVPYGDIGALAAAIGPNTAAFLVEPIQGEGGVIVPPAGYLSACAALCRRQNVLLIVDEVQTGLGRTGRLFAYQHEALRPDGIILGKALGGGLLPVSAFLADDAVMQVFTPGDHGSTFGGNPLAAAVALTALDLLEDENLVEHAAQLGRHLQQRLAALAAELPAIRAVRGVGLFAGIELEPSRADARQLAEQLLQRGILSKDTHQTVLRIAPPLIIDQPTLDWGIDQIAETLRDMARPPRRIA
ncbi:MAG: ornithine--oxo-acid transaminase [Proteobacteria bacterium]|nr:ornithine--oxo-acid transaminase [Pseudomonadota bacterium]